jgi:hypothetical protein
MTDFLALLGAGGSPNLMAQDAAAEKPQYRRLQRAEMSLFVGKHQFNLTSVSWSDDLRAAQVPLALRGLAREDVALERGAAHDLAGAGLLEPLRRTPVRLQLHLLRHVFKLLSFNF